MIGVLLSTTVYAEQVKAAVTPAKQLLLALFFIAIGMAIDLKQVVELKVELLFYLPILLLVKFVILFVLARLFRLSVRSAILTGLLMMPFDEIAYVIFASANANRLLTAHDYTVGLCVISISFVVSPVLINLGYKLTEQLGRPGPDMAQAAMLGNIGGVVVAGYSYVGRAICGMLERAQIPYTAFDVDPANVEKGKQTKHNVHYGDLTELSMMGAVAIGRCRLVIVTTDVFDSTKRMLGNVREFYPHVPVMTAVQFLAQRDELRQLGAKQIFALTPGGALSFGRSVLDRLGVDVKRAEAIVSWLESNDYAALRGVGGAEPEKKTEAR